MDMNEYVENAMRTAKIFVSKDFSSNDMDLLHAALGLSSDAGEFVDAIKKHFIYGQELQVNNCIEELGDCMWFIALACCALRVSMKEVMETNIRKLARRYPDKYSDEAAIKRADKSELQEALKWAACNPVEESDLPDDYEVN